MEESLLPQNPLAPLHLGRQVPVEPDQLGPNLCAYLYIYDWRHVLQLDLLGQNCLHTFPSEQIQFEVSKSADSPSLVLLLWHGEQVGHDVAPVCADPEGGRRRVRGLEERASKPETPYQRSVLWDSSSLGQTGLWRQDLQIGSQGVHKASNYLQLGNVLALLVVQQSFLLIAPIGVRSTDLVERLAQGAGEGLVGASQRQNPIVQL